jgi:23S rRNA (uracil1939-C5)-methyltransferase
MRVTIERLGQRGDGIASFDNKTMHLPKVLPGETVDLTQGQVTKIVSSSAERIDAFCGYYARCGGCKFQHWKVEPYAAWKLDLLQAALAAQKLETNILPMVDAHGDGRRRVTLHVRQQEGRWVAGFMEQKSHDLVAIDTCPVLAEGLRHAPLIAAAFGTPLGACDVAITLADNGLDVSIKAERQAVLRRVEVLNDLVKKHRILRLNINGETHVAAETPVIRMGKANVPLPVISFLQATQKGEEALAALVLDAVKSAKSVADLFCGIGPFALRIAEKAKVLAVDSDKPSIASLQFALRNTQGLKPIDVKARDLFRDPITVMELKDFDAVVLDPPRSGAEAQVRLLAKSSVQRIVMVSCDVTTFARDAAILVNGGYRFKSVTPVDQFKWTGHLEMVGVYEKKN